MAGKMYGSDVIAELMRNYGIRHVALNPGSTFRGLHDSLVNYTDNDPEMIECTHEELAVAMAHGYAKATGKPMAAIVHDVVGLLHANMAIYYAYIDRAPVLVLGATGPMEVGRRRPYIDWIHTAMPQGEAVRRFTRWDYQPFGLEDTIDSFARGYRVAMTDPQGPVYLCYDAGFQEDEIDPADVAALGGTGMREGAAHPTRLHGDPEAIGRLASMLVKAANPVFVAAYVGRRPEGMPALTALAEFLGAPVVDSGHRLCFPTNHPLSAQGRAKEVLEAADLVVSLDVRHLDKLVTGLDRTTRLTTSYLRPDCTVVEMGLGDLGINAWSQEGGPVQDVALSVLADTAVALPVLTQRCQELATEDDKARFKARTEVQASRSADMRRGWREQALAAAGEQPVATSYLAYEVGEALKGTDWVLTANTVSDWAKRLWDFDRPDRHPGDSLGTATQIGIALGVALAYRGTDRLVVDLQPDGDLLFDPGALWTAAYHKIPLLIVMYNNRAYYNDWEHQILMAKVRGRDEKKAYLGMEIDKPAPDFAGLARSFGWYSIGPIEVGSEVGPAVRKARDVVLSEGRPALVDVVTQYR